MTGFKLDRTAAVILSACMTLPCAADTFSYQGKLAESGAAANGVYDFQFELWSALSGGTRSA